MSGGFAVTAVLIAFALLAVWLLIINMLGFFAVMRLLSDSKAGRLLKVKSVIKWSVPARIGSSRAVAEYAVNDRKIPNGKMIGASRERLTEDQTVKILVSEKNPRYFAVDEQQIKNSAPAYVMMCVIFLIIAAFLGFWAFERIFGA